MKWYGYLLIFFTTFFIIGAINGYRAKPDPNSILEKSYDHIRIHFNESNEVILYSVDDHDLLTYGYRVQTKEIIQLNGEIVFEDIQGLFPLDADDIILGLALSASGIPTVAELTKRGKSKKRTGKAKSTKSSSRSKMLGAILGMVSGYSLGYHLFKPTIDNELLMVEFHKKEYWEQLNWKLVKNRISQLSLCFRKLEVSRNEEEMDPLSYESKFIHRTINDLFQINLDIAKFSADFNYIYDYTQFCHEWLQHYFYSLNVDQPNAFPKDRFEISAKKSIMAMKEVLNNYKSRDDYEWRELYDALDTVINYENMRYLNYAYSESRDNDKIKMALSEYLTRYKNLLLYAKIKHESNNEDFCITHETLCDHLEHVLLRYDSIMTANK